MSLYIILTFDNVFHDVNKKKISNMYIYFFEKKKLTFFVNSYLSISLDGSQKKNCKKPKKTKSFQELQKGLRMAESFSKLHS